MAADLKLLPQGERLLSGALSSGITAIATTMDVNNPPTASKLPTYFEIDYGTDAAEVVRVIDVSGNTLTIERGVNSGGVGVEHLVNANYKQKITNQFGTLVTAALQNGWLPEDTSYTFARVSTSSFKVTASGVDRTALYCAGRQIRLNGSVIVTISSSSYSNPDTTVTVLETTVPASITSIELEVGGQGAFQRTAMYMDTIYEKTAANGITIDGLKIKDGFINIGYFNAPRGYLLNGKIVPSVASNNLTIAIKGLDGNDPSATNPVYCRIGDTIRAITSALSVTKNAGTNWCNSGGAELATKEVDYFVYLGYNSTDGVTIGFSRIPYAREYGDFNTTATNDRYCAISNISNAASGDDYELVGRFAATLSSGAGYTWSVPTFSNINLVQRPIYETRYLSCVGSWTVVSGSNPTLNNGTLTAFYKIKEDTIRFKIYLKIGSSTSIGSGIYIFAMPIAPSGDMSYGCMGNATLFDATGNTYNIAIATYGVAASILGRIDGAGFFTNSAPITIAQDDEFSATVEVRLK